MGWRVFGFVFDRVIFCRCFFDLRISCDLVCVFPLMRALCLLVD